MKLRLVTKYGTIWREWDLPIKAAQLEEELHREADICRVLEMQEEAEKVRERAQ